MLCFDFCVVLVMAYSASIVLNPYRVLLAICDELTCDAGQDSAWWDVSQSRTQLERLFGMCWDIGGVYVVPWQEERSLDCSHCLDVSLTVIDYWKGGCEGECECNKGRVSFHGIPFAVTKPYRYQ